MKRIAVVLIAIGLLAACSTSTPTKTVTVTKTVEAPATDADATGVTGAAGDADVVAAESELTVSQQNAIESAQSYLDTSAFSEAGLISELSSKWGEGFPKADAVFAVKHIDVNWNEQAAQSAKDYLKLSSFSCSGLIDQLESKYGDGFTHSQAVYGANQTGVCG